MWRAFLARDPRADGAFVVAVVTTGIYCRPTCPARRPLRRNVRFLPTSGAAEREGFRACLRCRPKEAATDPSIARALRICRHIESNPWERPTLGTLARLAGASPFHLQRTFRALVGVSPREYAEACRLDRLKQRLRKGDNVTRAMHEAGYGSSSRLYERAASRLGMTPGAWRRGGRDAIVHYTIVSCPLGRMLVAATAKGVCAVSLGETDQRLVRALRDDLPQADLVRVEPKRAGRLARWTRHLEEHLAGRHPRPALPLDIRATAFQWRVYEALRAIPAGATLSYGEIAKALGVPRGARAVGRACATNPVSIVIPCHRAVGADGSLTGYRWGRLRKKTLLEMESAARKTR